MKSKKVDLWVLFHTLALLIVAGFMISALRQVSQIEEDIQETRAEIETTRQKLEEIEAEHGLQLEDLETYVEEQQKQIEEQAEQIATQKRNLHNTNQAFTSFRKQSQQTEEELREELKKD
jgi:uncharacterized protein (DUF3084 family)